MKSLIAMMMLVGSAAYADGFVCYTKSNDLKIKMLNHTQPEDGTRTGSVMIVSDQTIQDGKKTTVAFRSEDETLTTSGTRWIGTLPEDSELKGGRNIAGTKLAYVDSFIVTVAHFYDAPVANGTKLYGGLTVVKKDGEKLREELNCYRYLKN